MDYPPRMAGGTTIHTYQMAKSFADLGHKPSVIAARHPSAPNEEHGAIDIYRVRRPYTLFSAFKTARLRQEMDIIHGHGTCAYGFMRLYSFPIIIKMHSTWLAEYTRYRQLGQSTRFMRSYVRMDKYCATNAEAVIAISEVIKEETMLYGVPEERITVIHNGIDETPFRNAQTRRTECGFEDGIIIGYIGRLAPHKGVMTLARAFKLLAGKYDDIRLLVVGDGPERKAMETALSPIKARVRFTGYVPRESVADYYATSDIMVYPTLYEPLGNVILESMAAGKPLIASRTGGIPEIFHDKAGIMIDPPEQGEPGQLIAALEKLITSDSTRTQMGTAGQKEIKNYSWEKVCLKTVEVMENVLRV